MFPQYITDLEFYTPARTLRLTNQMLLAVPHSKKKSKGDRAFIVASKLWNNLLLYFQTAQSIKVFMSLWRMHLLTLPFEERESGVLEMFALKLISCGMQLLFW